MSVDYRGLRLVEQTLEAGKRREAYTPGDAGHDAAKAEAYRLYELLVAWCGEQFGFYDLGDAQEKANELLRTFTE